MQIPSSNFPAATPGAAPDLALLSLVGEEAPLAEGTEFAALMDPTTAPVQTATTSASPTTGGEAGAAILAAVCPPNRAVPSWRSSEADDANASSTEERIVGESACDDEAVGGRDAIVDEPVSAAPAPVRERPSELSRRRLETPLEEAAALIATPVAFVEPAAPTAPTETLIPPMQSSPAVDNHATSATASNDTRGVVRATPDHVERLRAAFGDETSPAKRETASLPHAAGITEEASVNQPTSVAAPQTVGEAGPKIAVAGGEPGPHAPFSVETDTERDERKNDAPARAFFAIRRESRPSIETPAEKFAAWVTTQKSAPAPTPSRTNKIADVASHERVGESDESVGTAVAKPETVMPISHPAAHLAFVNFRVESVSGDVATAGPAQLPAAESSGAPLMTAHRAVEAVFMAVNQAAADRHGAVVTLQFCVGGSDLAVRVQVQGDAVHTTFRTESPELRAVLAQEWSATASSFTGETLRLAEPVFTADGGSSMFSERDSSQSWQEPAESRFAPARPRRAARTTSPRVASVDAPLSVISSLGRLQTFA